MLSLESILVIVRPWGRPSLEAELRIDDFLGITLALLTGLKAKLLSVLSVDWRPFPVLPLSCSFRFQAKALLGLGVPCLWLEDGWLEEFIFTDITESWEESISATLSWESLLISTFDFDRKGVLVLLCRDMLLDESLLSIFWRTGYELDLWNLCSASMLLETCVCLERVSDDLSSSSSSSPLQRYESFSDLYCLSCSSSMLEMPSRRPDVFSWSLSFSFSASHFSVSSFSFLMVTGFWAVVSCALEGKNLKRKRKKR